MSSTRVEPTVIDAGGLDLSRFIRPGDTVAWGQACGEPLTLLEKLVDQSQSFSGARCFRGIPVADTLQPRHAEHLRFLSYCGTGANRKFVREGALDIYPVHYSTLPTVLTQGSLAVDVALIQVSPPDEDGRYSFGLSDDYASTIARHARVVIAEVNDQVPQTSGMNSILAEDITALVPTSRAIPEQHAADATDEVRQVARNVAALVPDGSTLQLGLGNLPATILSELRSKNDLGIHSGLISDDVVHLMEAGVINNRVKSIDQGRTVAGLVIGTKQLFEFVHQNPAIWLCGTEYTHAPKVLGAHERFVAINSAIEVDLTGQINAEVAAGAYVGAVGGSADFLRAAAHSKDGIPIIALPSMTNGASRIVRNLSGPVTTSRADAGIIVTEHGVADLRGKSLAERREMMIRIAAPEMRDDLTA